MLRRVFKLAGGLGCHRPGQSITTTATIPRPSLSPFTTTYTRIPPSPLSPFPTTSTRIPPSSLSPFPTTSTIPPPSLSPFTTTSTRIPPPSLSPFPTTSTIPPPSLSPFTTTSNRIPPPSLSPFTTTSTRIPPPSLSPFPTTSTTTNNNIQPQKTPSILATKPPLDLIPHRCLGHWRNNQHKKNWHPKRNWQNKQIDEKWRKKHIDWEEKAKVKAHMKEQGDDLTCWAFSTVILIELVYEIRLGISLSLSVQELIDALDWDVKEGGFVLEAMQYVQDFGPLDESVYKYVGEKRPFQSEPKRTFISGYHRIKRRSEKAMLDALNKQPLLVAVALHPTFNNYRRGIYNGPKFYFYHHKVKWHSLIIIGAGYCQRTDRHYWKVINTWGKKWGREGYGLILRDGTKEGVLGINSFPVCPILRKECLEDVRKRFRF